MSHGVIVIQELRREKLDRLGFTLVRLLFAERVVECLHQRVVLYQSRSRKYEAGYFATATLIDADVYVSDAKRLFLTLVDIEPLNEILPFTSEGVIIESYVRNESGGLHGRRFSEDVRLISDAEYDAMVSGSLYLQSGVENKAPGMDDPNMGSRLRVVKEAWARDMHFRGEVLPTYQYQCAITRQKLVSYNGLSSGLIVCHAHAVADGGKDVLSNAVLLSPDFHHRWDSGAIDILDDYTWVPLGSHQDPIVAEWVGPRSLLVPDNPDDRLSADSLRAHREQVRRRQGYRR
jgi:hypothetical protein